MPLIRYFLCIGSLLLTGLIFVDWYYPNNGETAIHSPELSQHTLIRIRSDHKWPERIVLDTSLGTMAPQATASFKNETAIGQSARIAFALAPTSRTGIAGEETSILKIENFRFHSIIE